MKPVAYLRFRAAQNHDGRGGIDHNEWLETCHAHEVGDDKLPAFPVWTYPVSPEPVVAMSSETAGQSNFIAMTESDSFKYTLEQLASGSPNPKERRRLVREVREAIKECAASQRQNSVEKLYGSAWIKIADGLPDPYEEVCILFDGVPRIARLCHSREYFQLATFIDSTKSQYIARLENVIGWMRIPLSPAPPSSAIASQDARDAARYRWLRHGDNDEKVIQHGPLADDFVYLPRNFKLDEMIDAAIATGEKHA